MKLLAFDTSSNVATIGLMVDDKIFSENVERQKNHAAVILPIIETLLSKANIELSQLDGIIFGKGPGSFTGIRISVGIAKAIAYAHNLPLYPISTLENIAYQAFMKNKSPLPVLSILDARIEEVYWSYNESISLTADEYVSSPDEVIIADKLLTLAGFQWEQYFDLLPEVVKKNAEEKYIIYPQTEAMFAMVSSGMIAKVTAEDAMPVYIRNKVTGN